MFFPNSTLIDEQPDDRIVHRFELREANRLTCQSFDPGSEDPVFARNLLGDMFADLMPVNVQVARVSRLSSV